MKTATSLVVVDMLDKVSCSFYTGYENCNQVAVDKLDKGDRLDKVGCGFYTGYENRNQIAVVR